MIALEQVQQNVNHGTFRVPWLTLTIAMFVGLFYILGSGAFEFLVFDKAAILRGEVWRFFTGHFVHFGFDHFFWDFLALLILGAIIENHSKGILLSSLFISSCFVSIFLFLGWGGCDTYCGLSGALSGLLVVAVFIQYRRTKNKIILMVLAGTLCKITFELFCNQTLFVHSVSGVSGAHIAGVLAGLVYWFSDEDFYVRNSRTD